MRGRLSTRRRASGQPTSAQSSSDGRPEVRVVAPAGATDEASVAPQSPVPAADLAATDPDSPGTPSAASATPDDDQAVAIDPVRQARRARWQRIARRILVAGAALTVVVVSVLWLVLGSPFLDVQKVRIAGQGQVPVERITSTAAIDMGAPLMTVDTAAIERLVRGMPEIRRATVSRQWPHTVLISVTPRTAVAVAPKGSAFELVDGEGVTLGEVPKAPEKLPLLRPVVGADRKSVAAALDPMSPELRGKIAQAAIVNGEIRLELADQAGIVVWGTSTDNELKAKVLAALVARGGTATWFDISAPGSPSTSEGQPIRPGRPAPATDVFFGGTAAMPSPSASASPAPSAAPTEVAGGGEQPVGTVTGGAADTGAAGDAGAAADPAAAPGGGEQSVGLR